MLARLTAAEAGSIEGAGSQGAIEIGPDALAAAAGWPHDRQRALTAAMSLVQDGLAAMTADGSLRLPDP